MTNLPADEQVVNWDLPAEPSEPYDIKKWMREFLEGFRELVDNHPEGSTIANNAQHFMSTVGEKLL